MIKIRALCPFVCNWQGGRVRMDKGEVRAVFSALASVEWLQGKFEIIDPPPEPPDPGSVPAPVPEARVPAKSRHRRKNAGTVNSG